jgi:DNA-directed RNA polymerase subunit M/transcription elongation factor TFIIS
MFLLHTTMASYIIKYPDDFRKKVAKRLTDLLDDDRHGINLEKGIFNFTIREAQYRKVIKKWSNRHFVKIYQSKLWTVLSNVTKPAIMEAIKTGDMESQQLAFMTHQEINPERWKDLITRKMKRDESKMSQRIEASTDMFTCKRCKSKKCTYYELQTRSADEPATIFITCIDCGKNWRN